MPDVPLADHGFGLFGPDFGVPEGGFCLSAFLVLHRGGRVLVGRMEEAYAETWAKSWSPNLAFYEGDRRTGLFEGLRFPATYLRVGEAPKEAAERVWRDQLGLGEAPTMGEPAVVSEAGESRRSPRAQHWDVLFLYEHEGPALSDRSLDHWAELRYVEPEELATEDLVMLHGELLGYLG